MGGVQLPFTIIFDFLLRSSRYEKYFLPELSKLSQVSLSKFFIFQISGRWFPWHPPINPEVFFQTYWLQQVG